MSYQALLFCPDDKTARIVTQVLSELEFSVEPCNEPFAAVKKLMAQHFDAVVVDCENEQNAALLFKSARNSNFNQSSLSVAVVEGQTGLIFPPGDSAILADKILTLLGDMSLRRTFGTSGRSRILERYDWLAVTSRYSEYLRRLPEGGRA